MNQWELIRIVVSHIFIVWLKRREKEMNIILGLNHSLLVNKFVQFISKCVTEFMRRKFIRIVNFFFRPYHNDDQNASSMLEIWRWLIFFFSFYFLLPFEILPLSIHHAVGGYALWFIAMIVVTLEIVKILWLNEQFIEIQTKWLKIICLFSFDLLRPRSTGSTIGSI